MGGGIGGLKDGTREERVEGERELGEGEEKKPGDFLTYTSAAPSHL